MPGKQSLGKIAFLLFLLCSLSLCLAAVRKISLWVTPWDITDKTEIDQLILDCRDMKVNEILAEVRYRGDALYFPNKYKKRYENPEPRSYIMNGSRFDPLEYLIYQAKLNGISVQAWVTVLVVTPLKTDKLQPEHVWYVRNDWITRKSDNTRMDSNVLEGAYLDPALPEVRDYLANIFADIALNYDVDGIHLDYIRYPDTRYGFHQYSLDRFKEQTDLNWESWREEQISQTVRQIRKKVSDAKPSVRLTAAVKPNPFSAGKYFGQNWLNWLKNGWIDEVYLMAYHTRDKDMQDLLNQLPDQYKNRIVVGLKAYEDTGKYPGQLLYNKIKLTEQYDFSGVSFFSYAGIRESGYKNTILSALKNAPSQVKKRELFTNMIEGKITDKNRVAVSGAKIKLSGTDRMTFSDPNGYFVLYNLPNDSYNMEVSYREYKKNYKAKIKKEGLYQSSFNDIQIQSLFEKPLSVDFSAWSDNKNIFLAWKSSENTQFGLYRKTIYSPIGITDTLYQLIRILPENQNSYTDQTAQPLFQYEYKLVDQKFRINEVFRIELDMTLHPIDLSFKRADEWVISAQTADSLTIRWAILDNNDTVLSCGIDNWQAGYNQISWNGLSTVGEKPKSSVLIFEYQIEGQKKWLRKYFVYM